MATWQIQTAKAKLSELLRAVRDEGPQIISVRGKEEFVVALKDAVTAANDDKPASNGLDLFRPVLRIGVDLDVAERQIAEPRLLWWEEEFAKPASKKRRQRTKR